MGHSAASATGTFTFKMDLDLDGNILDVDFLKTIGKINNIFDRTEWVAGGVGTFTQIIGFGITNTNGLEDFQHLAIMNLDEVNDVHIGFTGESARITIKIRPKSFFVLWNKKIKVTTTGTPGDATTDIDSLAARFDVHKGRIRVIGFNQ